MTQQRSNPPEPRFFERRTHFIRHSAFPILTLVTLLLVIFTVLLIGSLPAITTTRAANTLPLQLPGGATMAPLELTAGQTVIYAQQNNIDAVSTRDSADSTSATPRQLNTPGYIYSRAAPPQLTPTGQLVYSGDGIWLADVASGHVKQIATFPADQAITSLVVSQDGREIAWSTAPRSGRGTIDLYAGRLDGATALVYRQVTGRCPCFRAFSFLHATGPQADTTLLLTDDRGDQRAVQYGLWTLDLARGSATQPQSLLSESPQQGPLLLAPQENTLLYASYEGYVPVPLDGSTPADISSFSYANSLAMTTLSGTPLRTGQSRVLLPEQSELANSADYHWVMTPEFSPDGHTLIYVEFASAASAPFERYSALYTAQINSSGTQSRGGNVQLLATATAPYVELGAWLNNHIVLLYADNALYALDVEQGTLALIVQTGAYAQIVGLVQ